MTDRFQGDPYIQIENDGAEINFTGGQPIMDTGLENQATISLFTKSDWWGNSLESNPDNQIGSDFEALSNEPITVSLLKRLPRSAKKALEAPVFKDVLARVEDFGSNRLNLVTLLTPPSGDAQELLLTKNGPNWINQRDDAAYLK